MTSQLIISHQPLTDLHSLQKVCRLPQLPPHPDMYLLNDTPHLTLKAIRSLVNFLNLPPLSLPVKVALIHNAHLLTLPAQQALLKTLEEPPHDAQLILITHRPQDLIDTIHSRVTAITLNQTSSPQTSTSANPTPSLQDLLATPPLKRLRLIDHLLSNRTQASLWLQQLLPTAQTHLHQYPHSGTAHNLEAITIALNRLEHNAHVALTLDNLVLSLELPR